MNARMMSARKDILRRLGMLASDNKIPARIHAIQTAAAIVCIMAVALAGCFSPLYHERMLVGTRAPRIFPFTRGFYYMQFAEVFSGDDADDTEHESAEGGASSGFDTEFIGYIPLFVVGACAFSLDIATDIVFSPLDAILAGCLSHGPTIDIARTESGFEVVLPSPCPTMFDALDGNRAIDVFRRMGGVAIETTVERGSLWLHFPEGYRHGRDHDSRMPSRKARLPVHGQISSGKTMLFLLPYAEVDFAGADGVFYLPFDLLSGFFNQGYSCWLCFEVVPDCNGILRLRGGRIVANEKGGVLRFETSDDFVGDLKQVDLETVLKLERNK